MPCADSWGTQRLPPLGVCVCVCVYFRRKEIRAYCNEVQLISNNIPLLGSVLHLELYFFHSVGSENGRVSSSLVPRLHPVASGDYRVISWLC